MCSDEDYLVCECDLLRYRFNKPNNEKLDMCAVIDKDSLTIEEQYQYVPAIPNYHKWVWDCKKDWFNGQTKIQFIMFTLPWVFEK